MKYHFLSFVLSITLILCVWTGYSKDKPVEEWVASRSFTKDTDSVQQILRVAQLCDTQLGGFVSIEVSAAILEKAVQQINKLEPDMVLVAGDMVDSRTDEEIATFKRISAQIKAPVLLTPGNHDLLIPVTIAGLQHYRSNFGEDFQVEECKGYCIISVNSVLWKGTEESSLLHRHDSLLYEALQVAKKRGQPVVILTHLPPFISSADEDDEYFNLPKEKRKDILRLFDENGVILYLAGHTHKTSQRTYRQLTILNGESTCANFDGRPRGFRLLTIYPDRSFDWDFISCESD